MPTCCISWKKMCFIKLLHTNSNKPKLGIRYQQFPRTNSKTRCIVIKNLWMTFFFTFLLCYHNYYPHVTKTGVKQTSVCWRCVCEFESESMTQWQRKKTTSHQRDKIVIAVSCEQESLWCCLKNQFSDCFMTVRLPWQQGTERDRENWGNMGQRLILLLKLNKQATEGADWWKGFTVRMLHSTSSG